MRYLPFAVALVITVSGCATAPTVHQEDLDAWVGQPVSALEKHPIFITLPVVRTITSDGTEIRRYINGTNVTRCSGGGSVFNGSLDYGTYEEFSSCMQGVAACNAIFFIRNGVISQSPVAIGTGGMSCYSDARERPGFSGSTNFR
jgi:hypothetical protein